MQPKNIRTDANAGSGENRMEQNDELDDVSGDLQDEITGEPVLDEADMEDNDLDEEELDDIEWEEPNREGSGENERQ